MARRTLDNIDETIFKETIKLVPKLGIAKTTAVKVAEQCGITSFTIFDHFGTKKGFIEATAKWYDTNLSLEVERYINDGNTIEEAWDKFFQILLDDKDGTIFYVKYINEFGYDPSENNERKDFWLEVSKIFFREYTNLTDAEMLLLWDYITSMAYYYSEKIISGYLERNSVTLDMIKRIVMGAIYNFK